MKQIQIELFFEDNQYDVIVFDVENKEADMENEHLTDYAFQTKAEADAYIEKLRKQYDVVQVEEVNGEEAGQDYEIEGVIKPSYLTYILNQETLKPTLEELFFRKNGFRVPISVVFDSEYIYIGLDETASEKQLGGVRALYGSMSDFREELLDDVFGSVGVRYSVPWEDTLDVHILVPYQSKKTP